MTPLLYYNLLHFCLLTCPERPTLLYNCVKESRKLPAITTLIMIPPESKASSRFSLWQNIPIKMSLLWCNYCHWCLCKPLWKLKMTSMRSVKWQVSTGPAEKHIYADQLPTPPKHGWETCTILGNLFHSFFLQLISVCKRTWGKRLDQSSPVELLCYMM